MSIHANVGSPEKWVPLTDEMVDRLHEFYCDWIDNLTDIRERMHALRDEARIGWKPSSDISERLNDINERDQLYAAKHMDTARAFLNAAEAEAFASRPQRLARIERCKERSAALERACDAGWLPHAGKKWPDPEVLGWCAMFGTLGFRDLDDLETVIANFENKHAQYAAFAEDMRAGRIPQPSAPEDPMPKFKLSLGPTLLGRKRK
jgi:hypothetical protein